MVVPGERPAERDLDYDDDTMELILPSGRHRICVTTYFLCISHSCSIGHRGECFSLAGKKVILHLSVFCPHLLLFYYKKFNFFSIDVYVDWGRGILYPLLPLH